MRVRDISMDGFTLKIAPFSFDETEEYLAKNKELSAKRDPATTEQEWTDRMLETVCGSLNRAAGNTNGNAPWNPKRLRAESDMVFIMHLHDEILKMSGIRVPQPGEAAATPISR